MSNGEVFKGFAFGKIGYTIGEVCFNSGMPGYQEILTDPSYCKQIVTMTMVATMNDLPNDCNNDNDNDLQ